MAEQNPSSGSSPTQLPSLQTSQDPSVNPSTSQSLPVTLPSAATGILANPPVAEAVMDEDEQAVDQYDKRIKEMAEQMDIDGETEREQQELEEEEERKALQQAEERKKRRAEAAAAAAAA